MTRKIRELQAKRATHVGAMGALNDKTIADGGRAFTTEEQADYDQHAAQVKSIDAAIAREQELVALGLVPQDEPTQAAVRGPPGAGAGVLVDNGRISVAENRDADPKRGFKHFGEFAQSVRNASMERGLQHIDPRLAGLFQKEGLNAAAPTTYGNEAAGTDGGFAVPPQFSTDIFVLTDKVGDIDLLPITESVEIESNSMAFPKDETVAWGTDGIRAYWQAEANSGTQTKPKLGLAEMRMKKLLALVPVSDELLAEAPALGSYLPKKMALSILWKRNEAILTGNGAGIPQGALSSGAVVTVAKESGQATQTLQPQNVAKMIARLPSGSYSNAIWLINNDVLPALFTLTLGNYPIYLPGGAQIGGIQMSPYGTLLGRPIVVTQHAKSFSSQGDIMLVDLSYYRTIVKAGGIAMAQSLHLYFDADAAAFRAIFRMDGQSKIAAAINPANGSNTLSPFVQLGAR